MTPSGSMTNPLLLPIAGAGASGTNERGASSRSRALGLNEGDKNDFIEVVILLSFSIWKKIF
jgi:hypothetical protein